jgi:hypothetical protein
MYSVAVIEKDVRQMFSNPKKKIKMDTSMTSLTKVYQSVVFFLPKCAKTHLRASVISKFFRGYTPGPPLKMDRGREKVGRKGQGQGRDRRGNRVGAGGERVGKGKGRKRGFGPPFFVKSLRLC